MNVDPRKAATSAIPFPGPENYLPEVYVAKDRALGMVNLTRGRHTLSFVCTGKDPHSVGYNFGLNDVVLEKVPSLVEEVDQVRTDEAPVSANSSSAGPIYRGHPLSYYLAKLNSAPRGQKASVLQAIGEFTSDGAPAIQRLDSFLSDDSTDVRAAAISSLAKIGADNPSGIPGLIKGLSDSDPTIRGLSALALKSIGPNAAAATTQLAQSLSDPMESVRVAAGEALGAIGPAASAVTPALAARLSDKNEGRLVSRTAMEALGRIGPRAQAALPALKEIAEKTGPESIAAQTIRLIEGKEVPTYY